MSNKPASKKTDMPQQANKFAILNRCSGSKIKVQYKQEEDRSPKNTKKNDIPPRYNTTIEKIEPVVVNNVPVPDTQPAPKIQHKNFYQNPERIRFDRIRREFRKNTSQRELYIEKPEDATELGNTLYLHSPWTVWVHKFDCQLWTEDSYTNIYVIDSIGSFWRFFNNYHTLDKIKNQFFIMRNKIKPIWEDNDNRNGGICSIKLDCFSKQGKIDVSIEIMICICMLIMNETFIQNSDEINGVSYSIKQRSVLIKLWIKNYCYKITDKLPIGLFSKLDTVMNNLDKSMTNKVSIRYTPITPEDMSATK